MSLKSTLLDTIHFPATILVSSLHNEIPVCGVEYLTANTTNVIEYAILWAVINDSLNAVGHNPAVDLQPVIILPSWLVRKMSRLIVENVTYAIADLDSSMIVTPKLFANAR